MSRKIDCPCGSKLALRDCCERYHLGAEPEHPADLVRARFSAFTLGRADFLWRTLHPGHAYRARARDSVLREMRQAHETLRYRAVQIHDSRVDGDHAQVLFTVRVFRAGRDRSFVELSDFERIDGGWRYLAGATRDAHELPAPRFDDFVR